MSDAPHHRADLHRAAIATIAVAVDHDPALLRHETGALIDVVLQRLDPIAGELEIPRPVVLQVVEVTIELVGILAAIAANALLENARLSSPPDATDAEVRDAMTRLLAGILDELDA